MSNIEYIKLVIQDSSFVIAVAFVWFLWGRSAILKLLNGKERKEKKK